MVDFTEIKKDTAEVIRLGNLFSDSIDSLMERHSDTEVTDEIRDAATADPEMVQMQKDLDAMFERIEAHVS